jgi:hypothetical protein
MKAEAFVAGIDMNAKRSKARELVLTVEGGRASRAPLWEARGKSVVALRGSCRLPTHAVF